VPLAAKRAGSKSDYSPYPRRNVYTPRMTPIEMKLARVDKIACCTESIRFITSNATELAKESCAASAEEVKKSRAAIERSRQRLAIPRLTF